MDREYIIGIILRARDELAATLAKAAGEVETYRKTVEAADRNTSRSSRTTKEYARTLGERTDAEKRLNKALKESGLNSGQQVDALRRLQKAHQDLARAETESDPINRLEALNRVTQARKDLIDQLQKENDEGQKLNKGIATVRTNQIEQELRYQATISRSAKLRSDSEQAWGNAVKEIRRGVDDDERNRQRINKQIADAEASDRIRQIKTRADAEEAVAKESDAREKARQAARVQQGKYFERIIIQSARPADVLARPDSTSQQEAVAERQLAAARDQLLQKGIDLETAERALHNVRQDALHDYGFETQAARDATVASREYKNIIDDVAESERKRDITTRRLAETRGITPGGRQAVTEDVEVNVARARARLDEFRLSERARHITVEIDPKVSEEKILEARAKIDALAATTGSRGGGVQQTGILGVIQQVKKELANLDTSTSGFTTHLRGAFGFAAVALIQPLIGLIGGVVAIFASLASAAIAAGAAIGTVFLSAVAQGIPVIGVFAAAMQRLAGVFQFVSAGLAQQQQRFIAQYQTAVQNALGINQIVLAQHNLSNAIFAAQQAVINIAFAEHSRTDALFSLRDAIRNVGVSELNLRQTRQQATRQLQDLIFQETQARLAAEASALAITHSQKALAEAIASGGDVQSAQLQLSQAQAEHQQAVAQSQRAIHDAAPGSLARQGIQEQVTQGVYAVQQAQRAVTDAEYGLRQASVAVVQAQRAVVDAKFQVAQAHAQVIQAQQAAQGYNIATAAQLAYLRSQMTRTELALAGNITRILNLFRGAHAFMRPITDAILGAFVPLTARIYQLLTDPRIFGALRSLATAIGGAIRTATRELTNQPAINGFINLIRAATANIGPFARIIIDLIRTAGSIANAAIPFVHSFLLFLQDIADKFSAWSQSTQGKNWLKDFFDVAFRSLEAFIKLGISIGRLVADVIGIGGGAQSGINILKELQKWVDGTSSSIEHHGKVFRELHQLWSIAVPTVRVLGQILGAVGHAFLQLSTSRQGQESFKALGDLVAKVLVPAFVQFVTEVGYVTSRLVIFLDRHPALQRFLVDLIATVAALSIGGKALGLIFGPLAAVAGLVVKLFHFIEALKTIAALLPEIEAEGAVAFLAPLAPIALVAAAIVGIAVATGNFGNLLRALAAPFVAFWNQIKKPLDDLGRQFLYFINGILRPFGVHVKNIGQLFHGIVAGMFSVVRVVFGDIGSAVGRLFGNAFKVIGGFFRLLGDLVRGRWGAVLHDFIRIGQAMITGIWDAVSALPRLILKIFVQMIDAILHFLGISSPSRKMHSIGHSMVEGLLNALGALAGLGSKIIGWIASGIASLLKYVAGLGERIISILWNGLISAAKRYFKFEKWLWTTIFNAVWGILGDIEKLGERIVNAIIKGIKKAPGAIASAIKSLIPKPLRDAARFAGGLLPWNWNKGGAVPGYGGGDIIHSRLEPGEHVWTKEEVSSAGGHGVMFAMRSALGGGGQGGPFGYQSGGAVITQNLGQQSGNRVTQGVTGVLGSTLANIRLFIAAFEGDWSGLWAILDKTTIDAINQLEHHFTDLFSTILSKWSGFNNDLSKRISDWWNSTNQTARDQLNKLLFSFDWTYNKIDSDTFSAIWYIMHVAQQGLNAFGQKFTPPHLETQPKLTKVASGGFLGMAGERGADLVHAVLGRGEAVLNYAQQAFVEPAMRSYYGFGLDKLFSRVRGEHAGDVDSGGYYGPMKARPNKFAAGGYVFPFPKGQSFTWKRIDQGQDLETVPGGVVLAIAPGVVRPARDRFSGFGGHYAEQSITSGPLSGRSVYYGHIWANKFGPVSAGDIIGHTQTSADQWTAAPAGWLELGFLPYGSMDAGNAIAPILHALAAGHKVTGTGAIPSAIAAVWNKINKQNVTGTGALAQFMRAVIGRVSDAANQFGQNAANAAGPGGQIGQNWSGPWVSVMAQIAKKMNWSLPDWRWLVNAESSGNSQAVNPSSGAFGLGQFLGATARAYARFGAMSRNPVQQIEAMGQYILDRYRNPSVAKAFHIAHNWYAKGGFVDGAIPILAHAGEWVLNKTQQSKLGGWLGAAPRKIANALGLSRGEKTEYATGGVIGGDAPAVHLTPTITGVGVTPSSTTLTGVGTLQFLDNSIKIVNRAQTLLINLERNLNRSTDRFSKDFGTYLDNLNKIIGQGGLLDIASQQLDNVTTQQGVLVSLAAAGVVRATGAVRNTRNWVNIITGNLRQSGTAQTALQAATTDLQTTRAIGENISELRKLAANALTGLNRQIANFGRVTAKNIDRYRQLIAARNDLTSRVVDLDSKLAQNAQDIVDRQQTQFQARLDQTLRGTATLNEKQIGEITEGIRPGTSNQLRNSFNNLQGVLSKVGPNIALGLAQMAQTIAQTLGDPNKLRISDQAVVDASERQREALQEAYNRASARAQHDPRWQKVADDLLSQLESATTAVVQAQAQALSDAISAQDTRSQIQTAALDFRNRLAQVVIGLGDNLGGISQQIGISRDRASTLQGQIGNYQGLLSTAQSQGNIQAINDLTQKIQDLTAQVSEANLQTQQLVTAYRQVSVSILQSQTQASSGFFNAANSIAQTLGAIAGNQNLTNLIAYAKQAAATLITEGRKAVQNIMDTMNDPNGPFGANQGQANSLLSQLAAAFQQGPQAFATVLASLAPQLASFEAGLPPDQQQLFQQLVQSLIDNTTASVQNTQQLQQLNATTNQQQFTSSAWTMFREAIFNGLGRLLPQYAMTVPSLDVGGTLLSSGLVFGHVGETITPASVSRGNVGSMTQNNHFSIDHPVEVADPVLFGNQVAWRLAHDPNSR